MLRIVDKATRKVLFFVDAWAVDCFERAHEFLEANGFESFTSEITFMGDMIWWVG